MPWGGVTFSSLTSLRGLPYRVICLLGMDDGMLPSLARADEFDLMAKFGKLGDRQRRDDERNLFLDLLLAARDRLLIAYTGRSIRDNAALPPAALIDELLDYLAEASAGAHASPGELADARARFVFEHPLQPFAPEYFEPGAPLFTYEPERAELARTLALGRPEAPVTFFAEPLPPEDETEPVAFDDFVRFWRHPARALLRDRLGIALFDAESELGDTEPFELDFSGRDALAERVLPALLDMTEDGETAARERARRVARASPEMPGGATGGVWQSQELRRAASTGEPRARRDGGGHDTFAVHARYRAALARHGGRRAVRRARRPPGRRCREAAAIAWHVEPADAARPGDLSLRRAARPRLSVRVARASRVLRGAAGRSASHGVARSRRAIVEFRADAGRRSSEGISRRSPRSIARDAACRCASSRKARGSR